MKLAKTTIATMAAAGLIAAPVAAQAAPARTASPAQQSEELAGNNGTILYVALAAFAIAMAVLLFANDDDDLPTSP